MCLALLGKGDILLWQVTDSTTVDGDLIQHYLVPYPSTEDNWPAARVKLVSIDGSSRILKYWGEDEYGNKVEWDGDWGAELMDIGGYWGTGNPTGNQSETGYNTIHRIQDPSSPNYPPEVMEALFIMELGYNSWDDNAGEAGDYVWQTLAQSAPEKYEDLISQHMYAPGDIAPLIATPWSPNFYSVPEPTTFLLLLLGFGILALRRNNGNR